MQKLKQKQPYIPAGEKYLEIHSNTHPYTKTHAHKLMDKHTHIYIHKWTDSKQEKLTQT